MAGRVVGTKRCAGSQQSGMPSGKESKAHQSTAAAVECAPYCRRPLDL